MKRDCFFALLFLSSPAWAAKSLAPHPCAPSTLKRVLQLSTQAAISDFGTLRRLPILQFRALQPHEAETALAGWTRPQKNKFVAIPTGSGEAALEILRKLPDGTTWGLFDEKGEFLIGPAHSTLWPGAGAPEAATLTSAQATYSAQIDWSRVTRILVDQETFARRFEIPKDLLGPAPQEYSPKIGRTLARFNLTTQKPNDQLDVTRLRNLNVLAVEDPHSPAGDRKGTFRFDIPGTPVAGHIPVHGEFAALSLPLQPYPEVLIPFTHIALADQIRIGAKWRSGVFTGDLKRGPTHWNPFESLQAHEGQIVSLQTQDEMVAGVVSSRDSNGVTLVTAETQYASYSKRIPFKTIVGWIDGWVPDENWARAGKRVATPQGIKEVVRFEPRSMSAAAIVHFSDGTQMPSTQFPFPPHARAVEFAKLTSDSEIQLSQGSTSHYSGGDEWGSKIVRTLQIAPPSDPADRGIIFFTQHVETPQGWSTQTQSVKTMQGSPSGDYIVQARGGTLSALADALKKHSSQSVWVKAFDDGSWRLILPQRTEGAENFVQKLRESGFAIESESP